MNFFKTLGSLLQFVRVTDEKGNLSITNITAGLAILQQLGFTLGGLIPQATGPDGKMDWKLLAAGSAMYLGKRYIDSAKSTKG